MDGSLFQEFTPWQYPPTTTGPPARWLALGAAPSMKKEIIKVVGTVSVWAARRLKPFETKSIFWGFFSSPAEGFQDLSGLQPPKRHKKRGFGQDFFKASFFCCHFFDAPPKSQGEEALVGILPDVLSGTSDMCPPKECSANRVKEKDVLFLPMSLFPFVCFLLFGYQTFFTNLF